jgi:prepilin-type N-terminal cleavage/methylation domain-containing protein
MQRRRSKLAFTLLEILLVLAILVVIAAVATPSIARFARTQELRSSADVIRGEWARARVKAMKSGRVHVFVFEPDGRHYSVDYWIAEDDVLEAGDDAALKKPDSFSDATRDPAETNSSSTSAMFAEELPDGVRFLIGQSEETARSAEVAADIEAAGTATDEVTWSAPILFYSDGTTSTAEIILANKEGRAVRVSLRGLTGVAHVSEVFNIPDAETPTP